MKRETRPKDLGFFSSIPSFSGVDKDTMQAVAQAAIPRTFEQGQVVFLEGEPCAGLYIVEGGWLRSLKMSPTGREQVIRFVGPGEVMNKSGCWLEINLVTVEALETARLGHPRQALFRLIDEHPVLCQVVIQTTEAPHLMNSGGGPVARPGELALAGFLLGQAVDGLISRRHWSTRSHLPTPGDRPGCAQPGTAQPGGVVDSSSWTASTCKSRIRGWKKSHVQRGNACCDYFFPPGFSLQAAAFNQPT
jgi:hypothetical protein